MPKTPENKLETNRRWRERNPEKAAAHDAARAQRKQATPEKNREYARNHAATPGGKEKQLTRGRRRNGFTDERIAFLREAQKGRCAMCGVQMVIGGRGRTSECADHYETMFDGRVPQHTPGSTKHPRGLICKRCNVRLGAWEELEMSGEARDYVTQFGGL